MTEYIVRESGYPGTIKQEIVGELVRCKECKHKYYDSDQIICQKLYCCDGDNFVPSEEDFCSHGERSEECQS